MKLECSVLPMVLPKTTSKQYDNVVEANIVGKCCGLWGPDVTTICKHCVMIQEDCECSLDNLDKPGTAVTNQQWSTPQREESRSKLPQGDERERHGEYLPEGGEQAQELRHDDTSRSRLPQGDGREGHGEYLIEGEEQAQELRHDQGWMERTVEQLKRDKNSVKKQRQRGQRDKDEKDDTGEEVKTEEFAFTMATSSQQVEVRQSDSTSAGFLANPEVSVTKRWRHVGGY